MITTLNDSGSYTFGTVSDDTWGIFDNNAVAYRLKVNTSGNLDLYNSLSVSGTSLIDNVHIGKHATASGDSSIGFFSHSSANSSGEYALAQNSSGLTTLNSASGQPLQFDIANSEKMRVHSNGYIGIGTTTYDAYLVVGDHGGGHPTSTPGIHMKTTSSERKHYVVGQRYNQ